MTPPTVLAPTVRTLVRTERGLEAENLKYWGRYLRSPSASEGRGPEGRGISGPCEGTGGGLRTPVPRGANEGVRPGLLEVVLDDEIVAPPSGEARDLR